EGYPIDGDIKIIDEGQYWRVQIGRDNITGFLIVHDWVSSAETPETAFFGISSVSPNPIMNNAKVAFGLAESGNIRLELVDALGNVVTTVAGGYYSAGQYTETLQVTNELASGVYFLRLTSGTKVYNYPVNIIR
ncbi:MAG: T9SS type A sorting domain-containing protein, partial [Candidatus Kapaibacteriota bacterium]